MFEFYNNLLIVFPSGMRFFTPPLLLINIFCL